MNLFAKPFILMVGLGFDDSDFVFVKQYVMATRDRNVERNVFATIPGRTFRLSIWTTVSDDDRLMSHLYDMAFT